MNQPSAEELSKIFPSEKKQKQHYACAVCGYRYHSAEIPFASLPDDWVCPICRTEKAIFRLI